jgi:hypothetical protein
MTVIINLNESCIMVMSGVMSVYVCLCIRDSVSVGSVASNNFTLSETLSSRRIALFSLSPARSHRSLTLSTHN